MTTYQGLDADTDLTPYLDRIKAGGLTFAMRYLKNLTMAEYTHLKAAGIAIGPIFESTSTRALQGQAAGAADGALAAHQLEILIDSDAIGASPLKVIFLTVDDDVTDPEGIAACVSYTQGFASKLAPYYGCGVYGCGTVLTAIAAELAITPWLAGAMGWSGSRDYLAAHPDCLRQGPTLYQDGNETRASLPAWASLSWPDIGTPYDPDIAASLDWAV